MYRYSHAHTHTHAQTGKKHILHQVAVLERGERAQQETARREEEERNAAAGDADTADDADADPRVVKKLRDTIMQRDNEISILTRCRECVCACVYVCVCACVCVCVSLS